MLDCHKNLLDTALFKIMIRIYPDASSFMNGIIHNLMNMKYILAFI